MFSRPGRLSIVLFIFSSASSQACNYEDYLFTVESYQPAFEKFLVHSELTVGDLNGRIVEAVYPVCDGGRHSNFVDFYVSNGTVRLVGNSVSFGGAADAERYYEDLLTYLSGEYKLGQSRAVHGEGGVVSERHALLTDQSDGITLNLSMVPEYDFKEYTVYLESYFGSYNPLMEEVR